MFCATDCLAVKNELWLIEESDLVCRLTAESWFVFLSYLIAERVLREVFSGTFDWFFCDKVLGLRKEGGLDMLAEVIEPFWVSEPEVCFLLKTLVLSFFGEKLVVS